jgi:hypothetical protein
MRSEEIPAWCFLTGQFLIRFNSNKRQNPHYLRVHDDFLKSTITDPPLDDFYYVNPGVIIMLCYGLLVYPVEYWDSFLKDDVDVERLNNNVVSAAGRAGVSVATMTELFNITVWDGPASKPAFLRKLRNSIAHSHVNVNDRNTEYTFWNVNRSKAIDFRVSASTENLGYFLTGIGAHFSGAQRRIR